MKALQSLLAVMLTGALSGGLLVTMESGAAMGKSLHHFPGEGSHGSKSAKPGQKSGALDAAATKTLGAGETKGNATVSEGDKAGRNVSGLTNEAPLKKGDNLLGKGAPRNAGIADSEKNQVNDRGESSHRAVVNPGKDSEIEAVKSGTVIADGPGHKTQKKAAETMKKITTIFRPHLVKAQQHPSGPGKIGRNAIGVAIHNDESPKSGLGSKLNRQVDVAPANVPTPTGTKTVAIAATPNLGHPGNHAIEGPLKNGPTIDGTSVSRPSNLASVGGPPKNLVGALSGSSFKPRHP